MIDILGNHISITKGDTGSIVLPFKQKCKNFNLNGWTVRFIVKQKGESDDAAIIDMQETIESDLHILGIYLTSENTDHEPKDYDWAVRITKGEEVQTVAEGIFTIVQGVYA
jgi:hypothetical protein